MEKLWFYVENLDDYPGKYSAIENIEGNKCYDEIMQNMANIRQVCTKLIEDKSYFEQFFDKRELNATGKWQSIPIMSWGLMHKKNSKLFAELLSFFTCSAISSVSVSMLPAHTEIPFHIGDTNAIVRNHLSILLPKETNMCFFEIDNRKHSWTYNSILSFTDSYRHRACNFSSEDRIVIIFDIVRPEFHSRKKEICKRALVGQTMLLLNNFIPFRKTPKPIRFLLTSMSLLLLHVYFILPGSINLTKYKVAV